MVTLNDYLYSGDTMFKILKNYSQDLKKEAKCTGNEIDLMHANFLLQIRELLEHNDFLTAQSQKIREFYIHMAKEYPLLAFNFKGRIKSLIRAEAKFNGYIVEYIYDYYMENKAYPSISELKQRLSCFRDLIAYRIVTSLPKCYLKPDESQEEADLRYLYQIANDVKPYYRDYICGNTSEDYQSLHITFYDNSSRSYMEVQLRTKHMDDIAEIGVANHLSYEKRQEGERARRDEIPVGECVYFDEAYERCRRLVTLNLADLDVNMFSAINNDLVNDGCGLYRGRLILPYEHLSRHQNELVD